MAPEPLSVSTEAEALQWLIAHASPEEWIFSPEAEIPLIAQFVCDMFWLSPSDLCRKLRDLWPEVPKLDARIRERVAYHAARRALPLRRARPW